MLHPVKQQLKTYAEVCNSSEEYNRRIVELDNVVKSEQWKYAVQILWSIKNKMAIDLLENKKFTELSPDEKDKIQTVYSNINEWINFLTNPLRWVRKKSMLQILTSTIKGEAKPSGEERT